MSDEKPGKFINFSPSINIEEGALEPLADVSSKLIDKISGAIGATFLEHPLVSETRARITSAEMLQESNIRMTERYMRAVKRLAGEELRKQYIIESIAGKAIPLLNPAAEPALVHDDWIARFFSASSLTSDDEMQDLWARILAGEVNAPGSFSKRTLDFVATLEQDEAQAFSTIARFTAWIDGDPVPFIFNEDHPKNMGCDFEFIHVLHLAHIGMIHHNNMQGIHLELPESPPSTFTYFDKEFTLSPALLSDDRFGFKCGVISFTKIGEELCQVCDVEEVTGFIDYLSEAFERQETNFSVA